MALRAAQSLSWEMGNSLGLAGAPGLQRARGCDLPRMCPGRAPGLCLHRSLLCPSEVFPPPLPQMLAGQDVDLQKGQTQKSSPVVSGVGDSGPCRPTVSGSQLCRLLVVRPPNKTSSRERSVKWG